MKRLLIYIMVCVAAMPLLSCEDLTPEFYQNKPVIEEVRYTGRYHPNYTEMVVTVTLDKNYGGSIRADIGKFTNYTLSASDIYDNIYTCTINVFIEDFDEVDYVQGKAIFNNLDVVIKSCDGTNVTLATYTTGRMSYTNKPSIKMTKVTRDARYLSDDNYRYTTEYTGYFTVTGAIFFAEIYNYLIGNWSKPGKGGSILPYNYYHDYEEGETLSHSTALIHSPSLSETLYNQFRGLLKDNKTEIRADKTISLAGTGDGWVTVSLVSSVTVPSTRSGASSGECIAVPIEREKSDTPKVNYVYTIEPTEITLEPIK